MGRNEIRLRRKSMSSGRIARHRNYGELMAQHEHNLKLKRIFKLVMYFLIVIFLLVLFIMVSRWEQKQKNRQKEQTHSAWNSDKHNLNYYYS